MGCCPNLKTRHQIGRKANKETPVLVDLREEGKFDKISYQTIPQWVGPTKDYEAFESRVSVLMDMLEALKDVDVNHIGLYGLGGVGKTMLAKDVGSLVKSTGILKTVVLATVTHVPDVKKIQQEIADWLDFKIDVESVAVRAARLKERIEQEEKILIILDDIWAKIELEEIGIPLNNDSKGCKILMTSRDRNVLSMMGVQRCFQLQILHQAEAWNLFEKIAGDVKDSDLQPVAEEVAKRCAGLPVLIVTVAKALNGKELYEWKDALQRLKQFDGDEIEEIVNSALGLSYNYLKGDEMKSLFLLCGQIGPYNIDIEYLLKLTIGMDLFKRINTVEEARNRLFKLISDLKASCLLLEDRVDGRVKMHDVVYNFAISNVPRNDHLFTVAYGSEWTGWPANDILEQCVAISLLRSKITKLFEAIECPKLESFLLNGAKDLSMQIPDDFFKGMKGLKVMDLTQFCFPSLPLSLKFLKNLQTLCLEQCVLEDLSMLGELRSLQVLSFAYSDVIRLPREIGQLTRLQLLDLSDCPRLEVIPANVLSCLTQLEVLYMRNSFTQWEGGGYNSDKRNNVSLTELKLLPKLVTLDIHIIDEKILPKDLFTEKLERYRIFIGEWSWPKIVYGSSRMLKLKLNTSIQLVEEGVKLLLKNAQDVCLHELKGIRSILWELDDRGLPHLKHLNIQNNYEIQYIIGFMSSIDPVVAFPKLESLFLDSLKKLEKINHGPFTKGSLSCLKKLNVRNCDRLKNLFSCTAVRALAQLEEINVSSCQIMEEIVAEETGEDLGNAETIELSKLSVLTLEHLPHFRSISSQLKVSSKETHLSLFNKKIEFPSLVDLKLYSINLERIWCNQILTKLSTCVKNLTTLMIYECGNLSYCESMEEVIKREEDMMMNKMLFPNLQYLKLEGLPTLVRFCFGDSIECPSLKFLWIEGCRQIQEFITSSMSTNVGTSSRAGQSKSTLFDKRVLFPNLEELIISNIPKLKMIWDHELQVYSFCRLKVLWVSHGEELLKIFPSKFLRRFLNLELLIVKNCNLVEEVFDLQVLIKKTETDVMTTIQLRYLEIDYLPNLKHIWNGDPDGILSFCNLRFMYVYSCPNLKNLLPFSIAKSLPQLEIFFIYCCVGLEEVVADQDTEASPKFALPRLKNLYLEKLNKLKCFYPGKHAIECKLLERTEGKILTMRQKYFTF